MSIYVLTIGSIVLDNTMRQAVSTINIKEFIINNRNQIVEVDPT